MEVLLACGVGFAAGWLTRLGADSLRERAIRLLVSGKHITEGVRVRFAIEREYIQDLLAEARSRYDSEVAGSDTPEPEEPHSQPRVQKGKQAA